MLLHALNPLLMKRSFRSTCALIFAACLGACSKSDVETPPVVPEAAAPAGAAPVAAARTAVSQPAPFEAELTTSMQQKNYDAAVDVLLRAQSATGNMSDDQRRQYAQQFRNISESLKAASATDPKAKAAYERMGRAVLGR